MRGLLGAAAAAVVLSAVLSIAGCGGDEGSTASDRPGSSPEVSATPSDEAAPPAASSSTVAAGAYVDWDAYDDEQSAYAGSDVVLFFHADWCPKCKELQDSLEDDGVPTGLVVVKVDFDSETDLRQEYGVTVQHTMVHVDQDGKKLELWTGSFTGADIREHLDE